MALEEIRMQKIEKYEELKKHYDPFKIEKFLRNTNIDNFNKKYNNLKEDEKSTDEIRVAGRIMSIRTHGKMTFADLEDESSKAQIVFRYDDVLENDVIKFIAGGDILGIIGFAQRTKAGELSIFVKEFKILSKNIMPIPDSYTGVQDPEFKYRKRYVDFIIDKTSKDAVVQRCKMISKMRDFLNSRGFLEVETPTLTNLLGGANAKPFTTHHNALDIDLFLRVAPELYLKRLIVGGFEKVYEIGRNYRNEGIDYKHNPEFTSMELYEAYADCDDIMDLTEEIIKYVIKEIKGNLNIEYEGKTINLEGKWKRISMNDAVLEATGIDFKNISHSEALELAKKENIKLQFDTSKGKILTEFFDKFVEDNLINPTFITKHPVETSPLAKKDPKDDRYTNRFELFINGWEIANAFSELNDPFDQYQRFKDQLKLKEKGDDEANDMDYDFLEALEIGLPPTGGLGIGIDRLAMLLTNKHSIRDILAFPLLRPQKTKLEEILESENK